MMMKLKSKKLVRIRVKCLFIAQIFRIHNKEKE